MDYTQLASKERIEKVKAALEAHGIAVYAVSSGEEARKKALELIPEGSEVMTMSSVTLDTIGLADDLNSSGRFNPVRDRLYALPETQKQEKNKLGGAPQWAVGSVHAITEDGSLMIASNTGSQLGAYSYGALNVLLVAGTHKIVKDRDDGFKRIYEHSLPLESERAKKAYGTEGSAVNKVLIVNQEIQKGRLAVILVEEVLGF